MKEEDGMKDMDLMKDMVPAKGMVPIRSICITPVRRSTNNLHWKHSCVPVGTGCTMECPAARTAARNRC